MNWRLAWFALATVWAATVTWILWRGADLLDSLLHLACVYKAP
jgi:hypothetical protein